MLNINISDKQIINKHNSTSIVPYGMLWFSTESKSWSNKHYTLVSKTRTAANNDLNVRIVLNILNWLTCHVIAVISSRTCFHSVSSIRSQSHSLPPRQHYSFPTQSVAVASV